MATKVYEGLFLLDSNHYARDPNGVANQVNQIVEKCGGQLLASRLWSEQKLAYPIDGHRKGTYWLTYFRMDSVRQPELTRECQLNEAILRNLVIKLDDRLVEPLVQHAQNMGQSRRSGEEGRPEDESREPEAATVETGEES